MYLNRIILFAILSFVSIHTSGQWYESSFNQGNQFGYYEVAFPNPAAAYITGDFGIIYKSTDAGFSWSQVYSFGPFSTLTNLRFVNADTGFVRSNGVDVYRTLDGGFTWTFFTGLLGPTLSNSGIKLIDEVLYTSYVSNDTAYISKSNDFGNSWISLYQNYANSSLPFLVSMVDSLNGYFINPHELNHVYKTNDGFQSIDTLTITTGALVLQQEFDFKDLQNGYLFGSWGSQSNPTRTWNTGTFYFPIDLDGFGVLPVLDLDFNTSRLFASTLYGKIFYSINNGQSWMEQVTPVTDPVYSICFANENQGIAVSSGKILYTNNAGFVGVTEISGTDLNIYPNPGSGIVKIEWDGLQIKQIQLYDANGKFVKDISIHDREFSVQGLKSGNYYLKVKTNATILTRKLILN